MGGGRPGGPVILGVGFPSIGAVYRSELRRHTGAAYLGRLVFASGMGDLVGWIFLEMREIRRGKSVDD